MFEIVELFKFTEDIMSPLKKEPIGWLVHSWVREWAVMEFGLLVPEFLDVSGRTAPRHKAKAAQESDTQKTACSTVGLGQSTPWSKSYWESVACHFRRSGQPSHQPTVDILRKFPEGYREDGTVSFYLINRQIKCMYSRPIGNLRTIL